MIKNTPNVAAESMPPDSLTIVLQALQGDARRPLDTLEQPLTREVSFPTGIYNVALLERLAAHCGLTPAQFAAEVFPAALERAAAFFSDKLDTDLDEDAEDFADAYRLARFHREKLDAIVSGWKSLHAENRLPPFVPSD